MFFGQILEFGKFEGANFKYNNSFLKSLGFLVHNLGNFLLKKITKFEEFEVTDFKCDNRFSKFWLKNTQISQFWCQICAFLFFMRNLEFEFHGADFKYDKRFFKVLAQKYPNKPFYLKNCGNFVFS